MVWFDETDGIVEIWDLAGGGDKPQKKCLAIPQNIPVAKLVHLVSSTFKHTVGTFGLLLKWGRNKVNLMNVRRDLTIADIGVDFSSETTYTLLIIEWPSSPSESDEVTMPRVTGDGSSFLLDIMDVTGDFARFHLEIGPSTRVIDLFDYVVFSRNHEPGTFGLFLKSGWTKVELSDKDTRKLHELGVDLTSPSKVMLLVEVTSESPTNDTDTETKASTTIEDKHTTGSTHNSTLQGNKDNAKERITTDPTTTSGGDVPAVQNENGDVKPSNADCEKDPTATSEDDKADPDDRRRIAYSDLKPWVKSSTELNQEEETDKPKEHVKAWVSQRTHSYTQRTMGKLKMPEIADSKEVDFNRLGATGYVGLVNQAMTCYLNSLLQALYMTPEFRNALYNWEYVKDSEKDESKSIPYQLQKLFLNLQTSSKNAVETTSLTKSFGWDSTEAWQQHDIQELCRVMFDALEQKFKNTEQADLINRLYEGKMIDYVKCLECGTEKSREDTFLDIPLPVRAFGSNVAYGSVEEALAAFVQPETLDGTNQYHCDTCNKKCDAHKGLKFTKFPYFLTLHLKRFAFDYNTFHRIKLNDEVTFPDVLNLNSFIPSTASEDASDENSSVNAVKSDDGSTADSGNLDDDCPPCNNGISVNDNSTSDNYEDEEDEGIERSNGPSTSSCNSQNHDDEKNEENPPGPKGPYVYELFSIMIHSGSASGGHYYAYIKDFRTGKWLCFNDQNVSTITYDDIQKTYGGGPLRAYYSGVYSSSSNAYMLMYRQIDPTRNALPMQVSDFPKHLQQLLIETQDSEDNDMKNQEMRLRMYRLKVFCHHPIKKTTVSGALYAFHDNLWSGLTDRAYEAFDIHSVVDRDQVRLVTYQENTGLIDCSFQGREHETLRSILSDQSDLLLEIRKKNETFKTYLPGGFARNVYVIDLTMKQVTKGPINVRGHLSQTIQEYKELLALAIDMEANDVNLFLSYSDYPPIHVTRNERTLQEEDFALAARIFVVFSSGSDSTKMLEDISETLQLLRNLIALNVQLPDLSEDELRLLEIPSLEEKRTQNAAALTNGTAKSSSVVESPKDADKPENNEKTTKSSEKDDVSTSCNKTTSPPAQMEIDDWHTPEQSNSEDSSLSYSDRTLVGEGDPSDDEDYPPNIDHEVLNILNQDNNKIRDPSEYLFKVSRDEHEPDKLLRLLIDRRMALGTLKKVLEPYIGVPSEYFRVFRHPDGERECILLGMKSYYDDGSTIWIQLGLALRKDEFKVSLYQLCLNCETEPFRFLCEWTLSDESTVAQTKREILAELKKKFDIDIPFERCRLRRKNYKTAANVFFDDVKVKDLRSQSRGWGACGFMARELIVQELPGKETAKNPTDVVFFAKRIPTMCTKKEPLQELVMSGKSMTELREKIVKLSGIPDEHLEMARGGDSLPDDVRLLMRRSRLTFYSQASTNDDCQPISIDDGTIIYYRDSRELQLELSSAETDDGYCEAVRASRAFGVSSSKTSRYSPRRERGLKIYFDDM